MIYRVLYDGIDIHTNSVPDVLINPTVETEMNTAGSFSFTLPPDHFAWGDIYVFKGDVEVYENNDLIFFGRVANVDQNWNNERIVECEGALAFFNDSIQRPNSWTSNTLISQFLSDILDNHNAQVPDNRKIYLGNVTIDDMYVTRETNYEKTLDVLTRMCIDTNGGYFSLRKDENDGKIYLDWLKDLTDIAAQPVEFGLNLLDISRSLHAEDICTGVLARGGEVNDVKIDLHEVGEIDDPSIPVIHHTNLDPDILWHREGLEGYGRVVQVKEFNDCTTVDGDNGLLAKATEWLIKQNTDIDTIEVDAAELGYFGESYPIFLLGQKVVVNSHPHHLENVELPMYKISMNLDSGTKRISIGTPPKRELTQISASNMGGGSGSSSSGGGSGSGGVQDVRVNGTSVVQDGIANVSVPTDTVTESEMSTAISTAVSGKASQADLNALSTVVSGKQDQLTPGAGISIDANNVISATGGGGTDVEANPSGPATDELEKIRIGQSIYSLPEGGDIPDIIVDVDLTDLISYKESSMGVTTSASEVDVVWNGGSNIGFTITSISAINLSLYDYIEYDLVLGSCYGNGATTQQDRFNFMIGLMTNKPTTFVTTTFDQAGFLAGCQYNTSNTTHHGKINVSAIGGAAYLVMNAHGWNAQIKNVKLHRVGSLKMINMSDFHSEEETVVGRWIDGKPLYERTYVLKENGVNKYTVGGHQNCEYQIGLTGTERAIITKMFLRRSDGNWDDSRNLMQEVVVTFNRVSGAIYFNGSHNPTDIIMVIQYTKLADAPGTGPTKGNLIYLPALYSEEEREIGVYINGKPLYQRTYVLRENGIDKYQWNYGVLAQIGLTGADEVWLHSFYADRRDGSGYIDSAIVPNEVIFGGYYQSDGSIYFSSTHNPANIQVTLRYTKTADQPGSGTWTPEGQLAHHYSSNEQVIGTWIDGSTIYEKSYSLPSITIASSGVNITSYINNYLDINKFILGRSYMDSSGYSVATDIYIERNSSGVRAYHALGTVSDYITLQYTKSS